jgi:hypothetical protein
MSMEFKIGARSRPPALARAEIVCSVAVASGPVSDDAIGIVR